MHGSLHDKLEDLKSKLLNMGSLVEESIMESMKAISEPDEAVLKRIYEREQVINDLELEIDNFCVEILALYQPVAEDLRFVVSALKINNDLERIGDLACSLIKRITRAFEKDSEEMADITKMAGMSVKMLHEALNSFVRKDVPLAYKIHATDDRVDAFKKQITKSLRKELRDSPESPNLLLDQILITRSLERIADHATNITEDVIYMVEGKVFKHHQDD